MHMTAKQVLARVSACEHANGDNDSTIYFIYHIQCI